MTVEPTREQSPEHIARERFGLPGLRPWQREAIEHVLYGAGQALVVAPTGGGKSLTYQLPATMLPGVTLVLSPLVALMEDQVRALEARGIKATFLASTLEPSVRREREAGLVRGRYKLVYLAPERLAFDGCVALLARLELPLVAIDEAHCIAQWGHDFRPDYLRIGELLERLRPPRVIACTATATPEVRQQIREHLNLDPARLKEILRGFARPNLHLEARTLDGPTQRKATLRRELGLALGSNLAPKGGAIVYAATRKQTEELGADLLRAGWNAGSYHAGMEPEVRTRVANAFAAKELDVVVATNAFGMGIDRGDIRLVLHAQPPASLEAYYQEVGRAGRDGAAAHGILLCAGQDIVLRRRLCELGSDGQPAPQAQAQRQWGMFRELLRYVDAGTCRHDFVLRYFGDEQETLGGCGHCDICEALDGAEQSDDDEARAETAKCVRMALAAVARARGRAGMTAVADMLRGVRNERTERFGFTQLSTFGLLRERSGPWVMTLLRGLLAAGWIDVTPTEHPVPVMTPSGNAVMREQGPVRFRLPLAARSERGSGGGGRTARSAAPLPAEVDPRAFERLRVVRARLAKERGVPAYVIAMDRSLQELAAKKPRTLGAMASVYGLGPARIESYGEALLAALLADARA